MEGLDAVMAAALGAQLLEALDLGLVQLLAGAVELLELVAEGHHLTVEADGVLVSEEGFRLVARGADGGVGGDGGAEIDEAGFDGGGEGAGHGRRVTAGGGLESVFLAGEEIPGK